jgi:hypothetical protein
MRKPLKVAFQLVSLLIICFLPAQTLRGDASPPVIGGCQVFPVDNIWNTPINNMPIDANSDAYVATIGLGNNLHPDFGAGDWPPGSGSPIGIPFVEVPGDQPLVTELKW